MLRFLIRVLLSIASIPGVVVHELGHQVMCWLTGTRVREVRYFRMGLPPGYVIHDMPSTVWRQLWISSGPLLVNSLLAVGMGWMARQGHAWIRDPMTTRIVLTWLGAAIGMHAFPSLQDANSVMSSIWERRQGWITRLLATPPAALLYVGAFANWIWLDVAYGLALAWWVPGKWL